MGLDQYLAANIYVGGWGHSPEDEKQRYRSILAAAGLDDSYGANGAPSVDVRVNVAYWRKANQIHKWFVDNVQGGNDDCGDHRVERSQLQELVELCKQVLDTVETIEGDCKTGQTLYADGTTVQHTERGRVVAQAQIAKDSMPTQAGFFFGGTDYDEWYMRDLKQTVEMLEAILADERLQYADFYYRSSW